MQFQVMETLGNLSPMPDDVGEEQVEKMRKTFLIYFMHVSRISSTLGPLLDSFTMER